MPQSNPQENAKLAAALGWEAEADGAPRVLAAGSGWLAELIIELAHRNGIPIQSDDELAKRLARLAPPAVIPEELYAIVAEVYAYLLTLDARLALDEVGKQKSDAQVDGDAGDVVQG